MIKKSALNLVLKQYRQLPLWGQIAAPVGLFLLVITLLSAIKTVIKLAFLAAVVLGGMYLYRRYVSGTAKPNKSRKRPWEQ